MAQCSLCQKVVLHMSPSPLTSSVARDAQIRTTTLTRRTWIPSSKLDVSEPRLGLCAGRIDTARSTDLFREQGFRRKGRCGVVAQAGADASVLSESKAVVPDTSFTLAKVSFGLIGGTLGGFLLIYGFGAYFQLFPGGAWSAIMLTYGFPLALIGAALKYAELKPVECTTYADAYALRPTQMTPILEQVRNDVTRFRYGDEQHLEEALKRIFRYGQGGGIQRKNAPTLLRIREEVAEGGRYSLALVFEAPALELKDFEDRQAKFSSFFGPGVVAKIADKGDKVFEVSLIADGTAPTTSTPTTA